MWQWHQFDGANHDWRQETMSTLRIPVDIITNSNWNTLSSLSGSIQWWHPERRFTHQRRFKWEVQIYQTFQIWNQWYPLVVLTKNAHPLNPGQKVHDGTLHFVNTTFYLPSAKRETLSKCVDLPCMTIDVFWYDNMWGLVMKAVPKLDESESGQMVLKQQYISN